MRLNTSLTALGALTLCSALPVVAQTSMTIEAESMTLSSYAVENGNRIRLTASSGSASRGFSGASGTYNIQVFVYPENDGQSTLELYRGSTLLRRYTYPLGTSLTSFTVSNVALSGGQQLRLVGRKQGGANARVDRMVLTQVAAATPTPTPTPPTTGTPAPTPPTSGSALTMEAEGMTLSSYAVENGNRIKLTASSGSASKTFSGPSGTYKMQVYVQPETDGQSILEVYKGTTRLSAYTYPLSSTATSFTIDNVALASGEKIRLVGRKQGGANARVDRLVFQPVGTSTTPTNTPPIVSFTAPQVGATLSGQVNSTSCAANASDSNGSVAKVDFYVGSTLVTTRTAAPYQCAIDTTGFPNGTHTLMALATDNLGATSSAQRSVSINNTGSGSNVGDGTSAIAASDILTRASADVAFAQQSGYRATVLGTGTLAESVPESGIHGSMLPNGETLRFGKVGDPMNSVLRALAFQVRNSDLTTSGGKRAELSLDSNIEMNKVYWIAFSTYVYDWGTLSSSDEALFGTQMHSGDNSRGLSPSFSIVTTNNGRNFKIKALHSTSSSPSQSNTVNASYAEQPIPFGRWVDFVFKFRHNTSGSGFLQVWMDGNQIVNHVGNLGFNTPGYLDFAKFGYYNWSGSSMSSTARKVLLRSPTIVADPTGQTYTPEQLRALVAPGSTTTAGTTSGTSGTSTAGSTDGVCSTAQCVLAQ